MRYEIPVVNLTTAAEALVRFTGQTPTNDPSKTGSACKDQGGTGIHATTAGAYELDE